MERKLHREFLQKSVYRSRPPHPTASRLLVGRMSVYNDEVKKNRL